MTKLYRSDSNVETLSDEPTSFLDALEDSVRDRVLVLDAEWNTLGKKTIEMMHRMGQIFREMKELLPHGNYMAWVRSRGSSISTASAWANVALYFESSQLENFEPSAARLLAAPSLPNEARKAAIELSRQRRINMQVAIELRDRYLPKIERSKREDLILSDPASLERIRRNPHLEVGRRLQNIRSDRDMSQEDLSDMINEILINVGAIGLPICGQSAISKVEAGVRSLSFLEGMAAAKVLGVDPEVLAPWNSGRYDWRT